MRTVKEIYEEIAKLQNELAMVKAKKVNENTGKFVEEVYNLIHGVGKGFVESDYYAPTRYYSQIPGVKNIRFNSDKELLVKVVSPVGYCLPESIELDNKTYHVYFMESKNFCEKVDY